MVTHVATHFMHRYQQKGESLQEYNFEFGKLIQAVCNHELKDITHPLKIYMYVQKLFNPAISAKTIRHTHPIQLYKNPLTVCREMKGNTFFLMNVNKWNSTQSHQLRQVLVMIQ